MASFLAPRVIVGCYTKGDYEEVANTHLIPSVNELGLAHDIQEIPNRGSWVLNNSACQLYLREMFKKYPNHDILYLDVDAVVHADPWKELLSCVKDPALPVYAYWLHGKELLSGTLLWPERGHLQRRRLLELWVSLNELLPDTWDQKNLQSIVSGGVGYDDWKGRCGNLPAQMCYIFDTQKKLTPELTPVIEHFQASRRHKNRVQSTR